MKTPGPTLLHYTNQQHVFKSAHMFHILNLKNKQLLFLFFLLLGPAFSFSQSFDSIKVQELIEISFEDLMDMPVSSASKIGQKASAAPSIITVVNREQIIKYQWMSLNDIAFKQAGFTSGQDRFNQVIVSRGISDMLWNKRLLILCDGIPFSSFQNSITDQAFSINMAKNVEIVRGPGAALYGSQAVTGVLQANSLSFSDLKGSGEVRLKVGDYGYRNLNILTGAKGKNVNMILNFNSFSSDGNEVESYDALLKRDSTGNFIKQRTQDAKSSQHFWTKLEGNGKLNGFSLSYHLQNYNFQMGHGFLTIFPEIEKTSNVTRNYFLAKYVTPRSSKKLIQEYALKFDNEVSSYYMQIAPMGFARVLPNGLRDSSGIYEEYVTPVNNVFGRIQWIYLLNKNATLLGGIEQDLVYYKGDKLHNSNVNLGAPGFYPFTNVTLGPVGPLYEPIKNHPVNTTGIYTQLTTGNWFGNKLTATLGARYDMYYYKYKNLSTNKDTNRFLTHFSPRIALIYSAATNLSLKALYGNAFRFASPFEQFIANSIISGSGRGNIKPEDISNFELSADWNIIKKIKWRNTLFYSILKDQIRSSSSRGAFDNVLNTTQAGFESEAEVFIDNITAFVNYSFVKRIKESSTDPALKVSNSLISYPAHCINGGMTYTYKKIVLAVLGHFQSIVDRRSNEKGAPITGINAGINYDNLRGATVKSWYTVDMNVGYYLNEQLELRLVATNLFNKEYYLINTLSGRAPLPFDYQQQGRRLMLAIRFKF